MIDRSSTASEPDPFNRGTATHLARVMHDASEPEFLQGGTEHRLNHQPETLAAGSEPGRRRDRQVSVTAAAVPCLVVAVLALAASRWLWDRQAIEQASRQVTVEFVLQTVQLDQRGDPATSHTWRAAVTGVLVNSGPNSIVVQHLVWGGVLVGGPFTLGRDQATPTLSVRTNIECRPGQPTRVPMPAASVHVLTTANQVSDGPPAVPDVDVWDTAIAQSCLSAPPRTATDSLQGGTVRYSRVGSVLIVVVVVTNTGPVTTYANPGLDAEGFRAVPVPYLVPIGPGRVVNTVLRVTVASCRLALTGEVNGITFAPGIGFGEDTELTRQLDRLATHTCART